MRHEVNLQRQTGAAARARWTTNEEAIQAWNEYQRTRLGDVTRRHYRFEIQRFLRAWNEPAWLLGRTDLWAYVSAYAANCKHYRRQTARPEYCNANQDLAKCSQTCPAYGPLHFETVSHHMQAIASLYDFLDHMGLVDSNPARRVKREWIKENRHRSRASPRRVPTKEELQRMTSRRVPMHQRAVVLVCAKTGVRVSEAIRLQADDQHLDLDDGWIHIPAFYGKRRGNRNLPVDAELAAFLHEYLAWRTDLLDRLGQQTEALLITPQGRAYSHTNGPDSINRALKAQQARIGLPAPRFTHHALRHFFSDQLKRNGLEDYYWNILRGDIPKGNLKTYVHPTQQDIRQQYLRHRPRIWD